MTTSQSLVADMGSHMTLKSTSAIIDDLDAHMKSTNQPVITMSWKEFYAFTSRKKLTEGFKQELKIKLLKQLLHVNYGISAIVIHRDTNFSPITTIPTKATPAIDGNDIKAITLHNDIMQILDYAISKEGDRIKNMPPNIRKQHCKIHDLAVSVKHILSNGDNI